MESIFKVGDVVRIRDIGELTDKFGNLPFDKNEDMERAKGTLCRICSICEGKYDVKCFCKIPKELLDECKYKIKPLDVDSDAEFRISHWTWSSPMLELVASTDLYDTFTKDMAERALEDYKDTLEYVTSRFGFKIPTTTPSDEKNEHKLELKVKNVKKVKLNFKN